MELFFKKIKLVGPGLTVKMLDPDPAIGARSD
jgi:hypothetical protein